MRTHEASKNDIKSHEQRTWNTRNIEKRIFFLFLESKDFGVLRRDLGDHKYETKKRRAVCCET